VMVCPSALQTIPGRIDLASLSYCLSALFWTIVETFLFYSFALFADLTMG
jgi:hypothetical protein